MQKVQKKFKVRAHKQWDALKEKLIGLGASVEEIDPIEGLNAAVFTADASFSITDRYIKQTVISKFQNNKRDLESSIRRGYLLRHHSDFTLYDVSFNSEGTGDNLYDSYRDIIWSGFKMGSSDETVSGRSDHRSHEELSSITDLNVESIPVKRPFFHIDTSLAPLRNGHILVYPEGIQEFAYKRAFADFGMAESEFLIEADFEDAKKYACNLQCIDNHIVMPECSQQLQLALEDKGYIVHTLELDTFIHAGGAVHCMTNNLSQERVVGGLGKQYGHIDKNPPFRPQFR